MLPSVLADQVQQGVKHFLRTTFPVATPAFRGLIDSVIADEGLFRGPYLDLKLPFEEGQIGRDFFPAVPMDFVPYRHQERAFKRLGSPNPASTLIATGTGSGKTECFLFPLLDHVHRHQAKPGIKAILLYPMNALATDQAGRIAKAIWNNPQLKGNVRVGLYVGDRSKETHRGMGPRHVITDRDTLRLSPPDILLTNYKMLDYLLIRPRDAALWKNNTPETLRYLVVDELHTFDGAQGTDLACLVRRLTDRLHTPKGHLCCVGTSATMGDEREMGALCDYATKVFNTPFHKDAVITEARKTSETFLQGSLIARFNIVPPEESLALDPQTYEDDQAYLARQAALWFDWTLAPDDVGEMAWRVELGHQLMQHALFRNLLTILRGRVTSYEEILGRLGRSIGVAPDAPPDYPLHLLNSFMALIATARRTVETQDADGTVRTLYLPLVNVRYQLWMRELRRMVAAFKQSEQGEDHAVLAFSDDLTDEARKGHLPVVHCRECGSTGLAGILRPHRSTIEADLRSIYIAFFDEAPESAFFFPISDPAQADPHADIRHLCSQCLTLSDAKEPKACLICDNTHLVPVQVVNRRRKKGKRTVVEHHCPHCEGKDTLAILGSRAASLCSVVIAQLYASAYSREAVGQHKEGDKKLITFSDSVQDASHRAAFFGARTYRFTLRAAIQQCLDSLEAPCTLAEVPGHFRAYWGDRLATPAYLATFIAPNMTWMEPWETLTRTGALPEQSTLQQRVDRRISWEIFSEYGLQSRIGRTLEKSGVSTAMPAEDRVAEATSWLTTTLQNEVGGMRGLTEPTVQRFIYGMLAHMKQKGAIYHPELHAYVASGGESYLLNRNYILPGFGRTRKPLFITTRSMSGFDPLRSKSLTTRTWYEAWAEQCFFEEVPVIDSLHDALWYPVLQALEQHGLVERRKDNQQGNVWGLRPEAMVLHTSVYHVQCETCGHRASFSHATAYDGSMPCLRYGCPGHYTAVAEGEAGQANYYGMLYRHGDVQRLFPAEHTGLLTRDERESLEMAFKQRAYPWHPNLISCTPTLEMGIDIGDLSNVLLCSVPPAQANYLQRIGRAGRKDGNALNITVANAKPHDLYFYADPVQMMDGHIAPPGVFLDAPAILERQLMAYCFDRWVASGLSVTAIPSRLGHVLDRLDQTDPPAFPHTLFRFIDQHRTELLDGFLLLFAGFVSDTSKAYLLRYFVGDYEAEGSLPWKVLNGLQGLHQERASLKKKVRHLRTRIRTLEAEPKDQNYEDDLADLNREREAFSRIIRQQINDRNTYNFFTDEGLLPNYAFPEAGVKLHSIIYRKKEKVEQGEKQFSIWTYDYERPSISAISELAPGNVFYAGGRAVAVNQVDLEVSKPEKWRLCPSCSYLEAVATNPVREACPRCGTAEWVDANQAHQMVALRQVFANTSDRESRRGDDSDDRENRFYVKETLVNFEDQDITAAYHLDVPELPYGFEFLKNAILTEINFGEQGRGGADVRIAGVEVPRPGFIVCHQCGRTADSRSGKIEHAFSCVHRTKPESDQDRLQVFLYRTFNSEAIRMLLPMTTFDGSERKLHSFVAALQVGLRAYFEGQIDHLKITLQDEPVEGAVYRKRYLILYDRVPGGTGFLKTLMRSPEVLIRVFGRSLDVLKSCTCTDGCYQCLFAYRASYNMEDISKHTAIDLLSSMVQQRDRLRAVGNLRQVVINALFDSELEARFIEAIRQYRKKDATVRVKAEVVNGKPGYLLNIGERKYKVEPQVLIGAAEGVQMPMKADFVCWPVSPTQRPIVVFTDGYTYHRDKIGADLAQRMALAHSEKYRVWSITYQDVMHQSHAQGNYYHNHLEARTDLPGNHLYDTVLRAYDSRFGTAQLKSARLLDSFTWLMTYLRDPLDDRWSSFALLHALIRVDANRYRQAAAQALWHQQRQVLLPDTWPTDHALDAVPTLLGLDELAATGASPYVGVLVRVAHDAVQSADATQVEVIGYLDDRKVDSVYKKTFVKHWNGFLRLFNLFQFIPRASFINARGLEEHAFDALVPSVPAQPTLPDAGWGEAYAFTLPEVHPVLDRLAENGWPLPETGYEACSSSGGVLATAELAWPLQKIAVLSKEEEDSREYFVDHRWTVVALDGLLDDFDGALPPKP